MADVRDRRVPQTKPVSIQFAAAENGTDANDTFTLKNVPAGQTVKVYTKSGSEYNKIGEAVQQAGTVTITGLNFRTQEAGRIYYHHRHRFRRKHQAEREL